MKKNTIWIRILLAVAGIAITIGGVVWALGKQSADLATVRKEQNTLRPMVALHDKKIAVIETDIKYIRQSVEDNAVVQQQILTEIRK